MFFLVSPQDVQTSPEPVQRWFMGLASKFANLNTDEPEKPAAEPDPTPINLTLEDVRDKAIAFVEANGEDALKPILTELGLSRITECPDDKWPELLGRLAVS